MMSILHTTIPALVHLHFVQATFMQPPGGKTTKDLAAVVGIMDWLKQVAHTIYDTGLIVCAATIALSGLMYAIATGGTKAKERAYRILIGALAGLLLLVIAQPIVDILTGVLP